jgi:hypothetical protein
MKSLVFLSIIFTFATSAQAGFAPTDECSNLNNTIEINLIEGVVTILTTSYPEDTYVTFTRDEVNIEEHVITRLQEEQQGSTSTQNRFSRIMISKKDGSAMPNAYNRNAINGQLTDDFVCSVRNAWID